MRKVGFKESALPKKCCSYKHRHLNGLIKNTVGCVYWDASLFTLKAHLASIEMKLMLGYDLTTLMLPAIISAAGVFDMITVVLAFFR